MRRRVGWLVVAIAASLVAVLLLLGPPRPAALPPGATQLTLVTAPWQWWPPRGFGCQAALAPALRVGREGDAMVFNLVGSGERYRIMWPTGFSARLLNGRSELVDSDGTVVARDGDVISNFEVGEAANGDTLVCFTSAFEPDVTRAP